MAPLAANKLIGLSTGAVYAAGVRSSVPLNASARGCMCIRLPPAPVLARYSNLLLHPGIAYLASVKPGYQARNSRTSSSLRQSATGFVLSTLFHWLRRCCGRRRDVTMTIPTTCQYLSRVWSPQMRHREAMKGPRHVDRD
jgi:hypothetical protein